MESIISEQRVQSVDLNRDELTRYHRHLILPDISLIGQRRLKAAKVLCVGVGGLGSASTLYLAAAGVGTIGLVDDDHVDVTNLHRQILYGEKDIGLSKLSRARERILDLNRHVNVILHQQLLHPDTAEDIISAYDIIIDGTDNLCARYLINDVCISLNRPCVYGSIFRNEGQCSVFAPHLGAPCYRCLYPLPDNAQLIANCAEAGVLGMLPGIIGTLQATEAIKMIVGCGEPLLGRLLHYDALAMKFREFQLRSNPHCTICSQSTKLTILVDNNTFCCKQRTLSARMKNRNIQDISASELSHKIKSKHSFVLLDVREPCETDQAIIPGALLIPLGQLPTRFAELNQNDEIVVYCKAGIRSAQAIAFLQTMGYTNLFNLTGGITAWDKQMSSSAP